MGAAVAVAGALMVVKVGTTITPLVVMAAMVEKLLRKTEIATA
tara:strand:- start:337 stop:465 length:129 start_codon:yes stop_codon:yes gene_type:complete